MNISDRLEIKNCKKDLPIRFAMSACLSLLQHATIQELFNEFSCNLILVSFAEV